MTGTLLSWWNWNWMYQTGPDILCAASSISDVLSSPYEMMVSKVWHCSWTYPNKLSRSRRILKDEIEIMPKCTFIIQTAHFKVLGPVAEESTVCLRKFCFTGRVLWKKTLRIFITRSLRRQVLPSASGNWSLTGLVCSCWQNSHPSAFHRCCYSIPPMLLNLSSFTTI